MNELSRSSSGWIEPSFQPGLVSVIIPAFNRGPLLEEAIDSVLAQTYRPIECIVADANSTDNTIEIVRQRKALIHRGDQFTIIHLIEPDRGACASRNLGLRNSTGEFIQFFDSDDLLVKEKISNQVASLRANGDLGVVWSDWRSVESDTAQGTLAEANRKVGSEKASRLQEIGSTELIPSEPWPCLFRRQVCVKAGSWNEALTRLEDWEYALRVLATGTKIAHLPGIYVINREHQRRGVYDHPHRQDAVERGIKACRAARAVWSQLPGKSSNIAQLIAIRYWEMGLEALLLGAPEQAAEGFQEANEMAQNTRFRLKTRIASLALAVGGKRLAGFVLWRYKYTFTMGGQYSAARYKASGGGSVFP